MPRTAQINVYALLIGSALAAGCAGPTEAFVCYSRPEIGYGLQFKLQDGTTAPNTPFLDVRTHAVDGTYQDSKFVDSLPRSGPEAVYGLLSLAPSRPGTYTVTVSARGYLPFTQTGIVARKADDGCGMAPETVTAILQRAQ